MAVEGVPPHGSVVLALPALTAAVHRGHRDPLPRPGQLVMPVAAVPGIAMELQESRDGTRALFRACIFGMNPGPAHTAEPEIEQLGMGWIDFGTWNEFGLRIRRVEFTQGGSPVVVEVRGPGIDPPVLLQFGQRLIEGRHRKSADQRSAERIGAG